MPLDSPEEQGPDSDNSEINTRIAPLKLEHTTIDFDNQLSESKCPTPRKRLKQYETKYFWLTFPVTHESPNQLPPRQSQRIVMRPSQLDNFVLD